MDFKQLEAFVRVVELGSFSAAARSLYLSQPTVSAHIASLEKELSCVLVIRTTKEVSASPRGKRLFDYATKMIALRDAAVEALADGGSPESLSIIVAAPGYLARGVVRPAAEVFFEHNPDITVSFRELESYEAEHEVQKGAAQLALVNGRLGNKKLRYSALFSDRLVLVSPTELPDDCLDDLSQVFTVTTDCACGRDAIRYLKKYAPSAKAVPLAGVSQVLDAVLADLGVGIVPSLSLSSCARPLYRVELPPAARQQYYLVTHRVFEPGKPAKQFIRQLRASLSAGE